MRIAGLVVAVVALVSATALAAPMAASPEPARAVTAVSGASLPTYPDFRRQAGELVDALIAAGVLQNLRGRVGKREVDRLVEHWRNLKAMDSPADQVAYILGRFHEAEAQIGATLQGDGPEEAVRALTAGPRSPVMEALYMAIVASALEEGRAAFRENGGASELDGILVSFGNNFWLIRLVYGINFPAVAERRFSRGLHQLAEQQSLDDAGPTATRSEG